MAGDWIKMRARLDTHPNVARMCSMLRIEHEQVIFNLYKMGSWFAVNGKYGKMEVEPRIVDYFIRIDGFCDALFRVDWARECDGVITLRGFCTISATRKSLNRKARDAILVGSKCANCGATKNLEIDHIKPISRGGSCDRSNLQVLCSPCNRSKGAKLPSEWRH